MASRKAFLIRNLEDVEAHFPADEEALTWVAASGKWMPGAGGGGGGGHTIQDEGVALTQRTNLNFEGSAVTVLDDSGNDATKVIISSTLASGILSQEVYETLTAQVVSGISHFSLSDEIVDDSLRVYFNGLRQQSNYFAVDSDNEGFTTAFVVEVGDEIFVDYEVTTSGIGIIEAHFTSLLDTPASFVTYSGAFVLVNPTEDALEFSHMVEYIDFNTDHANEITEGRLAWDEGDKTLELGMPGGEVKLQIGQEIHIRAKNTSGGNMTNGQAVYVSGGEGANPTVSLAQADERGRAAIALATEDVDDGQFGYFTFVGLVRDVDTTQFSTAGDLCWLSNTPGALQAYPAGGISRSNVIGMVIRKHADEGIIYVTSFIFNYVDELSGVAILNPIADDVLTYYAPSGIWINKQGEGGVSEFTELNDTPANYSGEGEKFVKVNVGEDALEFVEGGGGASTFLDLTDVPDSYAGQAGKVPIVNVGEDALEFLPITASGILQGYARAKDGNADTITDSLSIFDFDSVTTDPAGTITTGASWKWTAPYDCYVIMSMSIGMKGDEEMVGQFDVNGSPVEIFQAGDSGGTWNSVAHEFIYKATEGDYISVEIKRGAGGNRESVLNWSNIDVYWISTEGGAGVGGDSTHTGALADIPESSNDGDLFLPNDGVSIYRDNSVVWSGWGPLFPMVEPVLEDFTWINQGGATADDTYGGIHLAAPVQAGDNMRILKMAAPSPPYTLTVALIPRLYAYNYNSAGIGFRQSSDGKLHGFFLNGVTGSIESLKFNSPTSWNASYKNGLLALNIAAPCWWLRIEDDNTDRVCYWSLDGHYWTEFHRVGRTDFLTADELYFHTQPNNATWDTAVTLLSWLIE